MKKALSLIREYIKKSDMILLLLCIAATIFGIVLISSATKYMHTNQYVIIQIAAMLIGIVLFIVFSLIDVDILSDIWKYLFGFSILFICSLFLFGEAGDSGNSAWIRFGSIGIQPAEIVKIPFVIVLSHQIIYLKNNRGLNHVISVFQLVMHFALMFGLIILSSSDLGSALVYMFIFIVLIFVAGLKLYWFLIAGASVAAISPYLWNHFLNEGQKARIMAPYDSSVDPTGLGVLWQTNQSKYAMASGGFFGQGLFAGVKTQAGSIPQQHTDFIFAVSGEELGLVGCIAIIVLLTLIIIRCIYVGIKAGNTLGLLVCIGMAAMLIFQTFENIGMCIGITPVIGLTLPFFSYGGSSIITLYAAMGIVSGVKMRPKPSRLARPYATD